MNPARPSLFCVCVCGGGGKEEWECHSFFLVLWNKLVGTAHSILQKYNIYCVVFHGPLNSQT